MSAGRFKYNSINVDFEREWNDFQIERQDIQVSNVSDAGIRETLEYYNRDIVTLKRSWLTGSEIEQLEDWWEYVRDGSSFSLYKDKDVVLYLPFEGKSLTDTANATTGTFARNDAALYIDSDTQEVEVVTINTARFPAGKFGRGLLMESSLSNVCTNEEAFDSWDNVTNITADDNSTDLKSPIGDNSADKLTPDGVGVPSLYETTAQAIGTTDATFSVWLRCASGTVTVTIGVWDDDVPNVLEEDDVTVTTEWQRFSITHISDSDLGAHVYRCRIDWENNTGYIIYAWGAQLETKRYYTNYSGNNLTYGRSRSAADSLYYDISSLLTSYDSKFSIGFWVKPAYRYSYHSQGTVDFFIITTSGATGTHSNLYMDSSGDFYANCYRANNTSAGNATVSANGHIAANTWVYLVMTVDSTIANGINLYADGVLIDQSASSAFAVPAVGRLYLGCNTSGGYEIDGVIDDFIIEKRVLTVGEIAARYNKNRAMGLRRNYYSAVQIINPNYSPIQRIGGNRWDFEVQLMEVLS